MTQWLIGRILPRDGDEKDPQVRRRLGFLAGMTGVTLNVLLFLGKILAGVFTGSIAMVADGVNNLSDATASVVTLVAFQIAGRRADAEHPFGHGRMEYLAGLVVALAILLMGLEVGKSSFEKIFFPQAVAFSWAAAAVLGVAILLKVWLFFFYREMGRRMDSATMLVTATDAASDALATGVVLISALVGHWFGLQVDAYAGLIVAAFILKAGWEATKDTIDPLLGRAMDPELVEDIDRLVLGHPNILGIHDLVYHDYGPGRAMMSFHAEVPADGDFLEMHDLIDHIERELKEKYRIEAVIHMDPVVCDERTETLRDQVADLAREIDPALTIHDLRMTAGPKHTNVIFDVVVPFGFSMSDQQVRRELIQRVRGMSKQYYVVVEVDHAPSADERGDSGRNRT